MPGQTGPSYIIAGKSSQAELMTATAKKQRATGEQQGKDAQLTFSTLNSSGNGPTHN